MKGMNEKKYCILCFNYFILLYVSTYQYLHYFKNFNRSSVLSRLHREALKQSAIDPLSGKIDVSILTTGMSGSARQRKLQLTESLKTLIESKGKVPTLNYQKLLAEFKESTNIVSTNYLKFEFNIQHEYKFIINIFILACNSRHV
jgi:hypothetical protein